MFIIKYMHCIMILDYITLSASHYPHEAVIIYYICEILVPIGFTVFQVDMCTN